MTSAQKYRHDSPHFDVKYPHFGDTKGTARVRHNGKQYYFGKVDSPSSYIMFGLWKNQLQETGVAAKATLVRPVAKSVLEHGVLPERPLVTTRWFAASIVFAAISISLTIILGFNIYSTYKPVKVDGLVLSESELALVRGSRIKAFTASSVASPDDRNARSLELISQLNELGLTPPLHRLSPDTLDRIKNSTLKNKDVRDEVRKTAKPAIP